MELLLQVDVHDPVPAWAKLPVHCFLCGAAREEPPPTGIHRQRHFPSAGLTLKFPDTRRERCWVF